LDLVTDNEDYDDDVVPVVIAMMCSTIRNHEKSGLSALDIPYGHIMYMQDFQFLSVCLSVHPFIHRSMALQPVVGPWPPFQLLDLGLPIRANKFTRDIYNHSSSASFCPHLLV
jgi:hypothetical protein